MTRITLIAAAAAAALALAGCGSSVGEQAVGTQSGRAFVACTKSHPKGPKDPSVASIIQLNFAGVVTGIDGTDIREAISWVAGNAGPSLKRAFGTDCGAPTKPLTAKERAAAQIVVTAYTNNLH